MSDTPRTDAYFTARCVKDQNHWAAFARELERELAEARRLIEMQKESLRLIKEKHGLGDRHVMRELKEQRDRLAEALEKIIQIAPSSGPLWFGSHAIHAAREALAAVKGDPDES